jgi:hypothetical protein
MYVMWEEAYGRTRRYRGRGTQSAAFSPRSIAGGLLGEPTTAGYLASSDVNANTMARAAAKVKSPGIHPQIGDSRRYAKQRSLFATEKGHNSVSWDRETPLWGSSRGPGRGFSWGFFGVFCRGPGVQGLGAASGFRPGCCTGCCWGFTRGVFRGVSGALWAP